LSRTEQLPSKQSVTGSNPVQRATLIFPGSLRRVFFISASRQAHIKQTQNLSGGGIVSVTFSGGLSLPGIGVFTGCWWPFFIYRRKKYV
ncbi:hypothetical protein, partial [Escherichia coli]|uniref:hypothetical protein n=1 Tax=Escherichia coli TaxID=562 RepID=UPI00300790E3